MFFSPSDYKMYLALIRDYAADAKVRVLTYCLMSNHVHLVVVPEEADSLAVLFRKRAIILVRCRRIICGSPCAMWSRIRAGHIWPGNRSSTGGRARRRIW